MSQELFEVAFNSLKSVKESFDLAIQEIKAKLPKMNKDEQVIVSRGIGKLEKLMKQVQFPSLSTLSKNDELTRVNNEIISKLGEVQQEFQKLKESCLL